jgi:hypothetical protein
MISQPLKDTIAVRSRGEVCPMPDALCLMPYAQCPARADARCPLWPMPSLADALFGRCPREHLMLLRKAIIPLNGAGFYFFNSLF